jgi:hypothetical protein
LYFQEAFQKRLPSGSTATVALLVDGQILIANVGDSKAHLCTEKIESGQQTCSLIVSFPFFFFNIHINFLLFFFYVNDIDSLISCIQKITDPNLRFR